MAEPTHLTIEAALTAVAKLLPGLFGSVVGAVFVHTDLPLIKRWLAVAGGVGLAVFVGPATTTVLDVTSREVQAAVDVGIGLFGIALVGEIARSIGQLELGRRLGEAIDRKLGR